MTAFILLGIVVLLIGLLFLAKPTALVALSEILNRIVATDHKTLKYRFSVGLILIVMGIFFLFMAYYFYRLGLPAG